MFIHKIKVNGVQNNNDWTPMDVCCIYKKKKRHEYEYILILSWYLFKNKAAHTKLIMRTTFYCPNFTDQLERKGSFSH